MSEPPKPKIALKPRAGITRKTKAERDEYARQEGERAAARAAAAAASQTDKTQQNSRGAPKSAARDKGGRDGPATPGATGVFGAGTGLGPRSRGKISDGGRSELLDGGEARSNLEAAIAAGASGSGGGYGGGGGGGSGGGGGGSDGIGGGGRTIKGDPSHEFAVEEEPDADFRRDIDQIQISSDDDESDTLTTKGKSRATPKKAVKSTNLRPVRAPRSTEEDERANHAASKLAQKKIKSSRQAGDGEDVGEAVDDSMEIDDQPFDDQLVPKKDVPSSPELSKQQLRSRALSKSKDIRHSVETIEERAERLRLNEDIRRLREQFDVFQNFKAQKDHLDEDEDSHQDDKLILCQFPPMLPFLADASALARQQAGIDIKNDPDEPVQPGILQQKGTTANSTTALPSLKSNGLLTAIEPARLPAGKAGTLRFHKSGKVTMDWGGTDMEVRYGTQVDFLQDAVVVETPMATLDDVSGKSDPSGVGATYALGQVEHKLVLVPDWQKLYE